MFWKHNQSAYDKVIPDFLHSLVIPALTAPVDRGVYTIESLEQMLQKNFRGGDLTLNQGGECI